MREVVKSGWFARFDLTIVILSGVAWLMWPDYAGILPLLLLLLPWALRLLAGEFPFHRTRFDWLILVFLVTVWVGYWASYNQASALNKAWLLTTSVFLYYSLSAQTEENILWITTGLFAIGVCVSVYFFFTHNFIDEPRKIETLNQIGVWWTKIRPQFPWPSVHPNYISGVAVLTGMFGLYPLRKSNQDHLFRAGILVGFFVILLALFMATSRGIWMAITSAAGVWVLWRLVALNGTNLRLRKDRLFPILVLIYLCAVVAVLYAGPANSPSSIVGSPDYGSGTRAELFTRSLFFVGDFPITGGGLSAFPGLYSQYMLDIPYFYVINSHNMFLDVFIEQGVVGGIVFLLAYLFCIWHVSKSIVLAQSSEMQLFKWLVLCALVVAMIHGMVDDYLYNGKGSILSLSLIGISMIVVGEVNNPIGMERPAYRLNPGLPRWYTPALLAVLAIVAVLNFDSLRAMWYANLGAVELAKVELAGFPEAGWPEPVNVTKLDQADASLRAALEIDPHNRTANHRLGLISMYRRDFSAAEVLLGSAYADAPHHRGIIKSLGFCYIWLGESDNAVSLLVNIPETENELDAYYTWWMGQGRDDLAERAMEMHRLLESLSFQPKIGMML